MDLRILRTADPSGWPRSAGSGQPASRRRTSAPVIGSSARPGQVNRGSAVRWSSAHRELFDPLGAIYPRRGGRRRLRCSAVVPPHHPLMPRRRGARPRHLPPAVGDAGRSAGAHDSGPSATPDVPTWARMARRDCFVTTSSQNPTSGRRQPSTGLAVQATHPRRAVCCASPRWKAVRLCR
jgi:hypothetical protein